MDSDAQELAKLITVPDEFEASVIVSALEADGIRARADGGYVADFREGISAGVSVVVAQSDLCARHRLSTSYAAIAVRSTGRTSTSTTRMKANGPRKRAARSRSAYSACGGPSFHSSSKKSAAAILPGQSSPGGVRMSTMAQSGSMGICSALLMSASPGT